MANDSRALIRQLLLIRYEVTTWKAKMRPDDPKGARALYARPARSVRHREREDDP